VKNSENRRFFSTFLKVAPEEVLYFFSSCGCDIPSPLKHPASLQDGIKKKLLNLTHLAQVHSRTVGPLFLYCDSHFSTAKYKSGYLFGAVNLSSLVALGTP
jgi:hypothetical protein